MNFVVNGGLKLASNIQSTDKSYFEYLKNQINSSMYMKPIVEMDISKTIEKINQNKSTGDDNIGNFIIKRVVKEIIKPLTQIFNLSISTGIVPEKLKIAKVIPIYKKQDTEIFSNYPPVSPQPCFSKILERLVFDQCVNYINTYEILNDKKN